MAPLLIAGGILAFILLSNQSGKGGVQIFSNKTANPGAPGALSQAAGTSLPASKSPKITPTLGQTGGSPNSTLQTINGGIVVANGALGFFNQLSEYWGDDNDGDYTVFDVGSNTERPAYGDFNEFGI